MYRRLGGNKLSCKGIIDVSDSVSYVPCVDDNAIVIVSRTQEMFVRPTIPSYADP